MNGCPTTRRHPRSLAEAFPQDAAEAITHEPSAHAWLWCDRIVSLILIALIAAIVLGSVGCATRGAGYVPLVDMQGRAVEQFNADLAECQAYAKQRMDAAQGAMADAIVGALFGAGGGAAQANQTQESITKNCLAGRGYNVLN